MKQKRMLANHNSMMMYSKHYRQNILIVTDHFSSFSDATFVTTEEAEDLKSGIISLQSAMSRLADIFITVDNLPRHFPQTAIKN